ncbi:MAG: MarR family transcriptional regulator [Sedimenticola sp.]|nr:MarR family transcriptional regulator [Sedimenticola sp.]
MELARFLPYRLAVLSHAVSRSIAMIYSNRFDISIQEWRIIANLGEREPLSAREIGEHVDLDKVQMSRALGKLTDKRLVLRGIDSRDKRRASLRLSARGRAVYERIIPIALQREEQLLSVLSEEERSQLQQILDKLELKAALLRRETVD